MPKDRHDEHFKRQQTVWSLAFCSFLFVVALSLEEDHRQAIEIREKRRYCFTKKNWVNIPVLPLSIRTFQKTFVLWVNLIKPNHIPNMP